MRKRFLFIVFLFLSFSLMGQRMGPFCSFSINSDQTIGPYIKTIKYFCYFEKENTPDDTINNEYYFYFNLPYPTNEVGVRVLSPSPYVVNRGDQVEDNYFINMNSKEYFDPFIKLEYYQDSSWIVLDSCHNSDELPAQPSGIRNNAVIRYNNPLAGLYRLVLMDEYSVPIVGCCFIEIGTTDDVWRIKIFRK